MRDRVACRYACCSAFILFAKSPKSGKSMPLDAAPMPRDAVRPADRFLIDAHDQAVKQDGARTTDTEAEVYVVHFATCPGHMPPREQAKQRETQPALAARTDANRRPT